MQQYVSPSFRSYFPALFSVILAIYLYGIRPHFYIFTFKSKGSSKSNNSYLHFFPSYSSASAIYCYCNSSKRDCFGQSQFVGRLTFWGTICLKRNMKKILNILLFPFRPPISFFLQAFVPPFLNFILLAFQRENVINTR